MSATTIEWVAVAIFFFCLFAFSFAEAAWLNKSSLVPYGKAFAFSFATNTFCISIGFFVSFVIVAALMMLAFGGALQNLSANNWRIWGSVVVAFLFPVLLLILAKRLGLRLFKMDSVRGPWLFSAAASVVFLIFVTAVPVLFIYFV